MWKMANFINHSIVKGILICALAIGAIFGFSDGSNKSAGWDNIYISKRIKNSP